MRNDMDLFHLTYIGLLVVILISVLVFAANLLHLTRLYVRATVSGVRVSFGELLGMRLRKIDAALIVNARIQAAAAGLDVSLADLQTHYVVGGDVMRVVNAMIVAKRTNAELSWKTAAAIDLSGGDVLDATRAAPRPRNGSVPFASAGKATLQ